MAGASILVSGNLAYDYIVRLAGRLAGHLGDQVFRDASFLATFDGVEEFGGCAGNVAHGLRLLGHYPKLIATVGHDFGSYETSLHSRGIELGQVKRIDDFRTARCILLTDMDGAELVGFDLGAAAHSDRIEIEPVEADLGIVVPSTHPAMMRHAAEIAAAGISTLVVPGQAIAQFSSEEISRLLSCADYVILNKREEGVLHGICGLAPSDVCRRSKAVVVTDGKRGSVLFCGDGEIEISAVVADRFVDGAGCGDAFIAGFAAGVVGGSDLATAARLGSVMAGLNARKHGTQRYDDGPLAIESLFLEVFGYRLTGVLPSTAA